MPKKKILPTIHVTYDAEGLVFYCDGEPIEDMEFGWDDLSDPELITEITDELVEYIDGDDLQDIDNPGSVVRRVLRQLKNSKYAKQADEDDYEDRNLDDDYDDYEDD